MRMLDTDELAAYIAGEIRLTVRSIRSHDETASMRTIAVLVPTMHLWETVAQEALLQLEDVYQEEVHRRHGDIRIPYFHVFAVPFSAGNVSQRLMGYSVIEVVAHPMINDVRMTFGEAIRIHETLSVLHLTASSDLR